jgi:hypothetical protein
MKFTGALILTLSIGLFVRWCLQHQQRLPQIRADGHPMEDDGNGDDQERTTTQIQQLQIKTASDGVTSSSNDVDGELFAQYLRAREVSTDHSDDHDAAKHPNATIHNDETSDQSPHTKEEATVNSKGKDSGAQPTQNKPAPAPVNTNGEGREDAPPPPPPTKQDASTPNPMMQTNAPHSSTDDETPFKASGGDEILPQVIPTQKCDLLPLANGHNTWNWRQNRIVRKHREETHICGPKILIIGAMKCGTNTLGQILQKHPRVQVNRCHGGGLYRDCNVITFQGAPTDHFWEGNDITVHRANHPDDWFRTWMQRLPWTDGVHSVAIDKSPSYANTAVWDDVANKVHELLPSAKIIMTICNPAERAYSEYHHYHDRDGPNALDWKEKFQKHGFGEAVDHFDNFTDFLFLPENSTRCQETSRDFCHEYKKVVLGNGEYDTHIQAWRQAYGHENVLVLNMEEDNTRKARRIMDHTGLPSDEYPWKQLQEESDASYKNSAYAGRSSLPEKFPESMRKLQAYFAPHNEAVAKLLNDDFPLEWNKKPSTM